MQAITIAIGKKGIELFTEQLVAGKAVALLQKLKPVDKTMPIDDFDDQGAGWTQFCSEIEIYLTNGSFTSFEPGYQSVGQLNAGSPAGSQFDLRLVATSFHADYDWRETYHEVYCTRKCYEYDYDRSYSYSPGFGSLAVELTLAFLFDSSKNSYSIETVDTDAETSNVSANIPSQSIINAQVNDGCFKTRVSEATAASIADVDFATPIDSLFPPLLASIPASGKLTDDITFDFELGDSGLGFPLGRDGENHDGITIGATGVASYKGQAYDADDKPTLPIPAVPTDAEDHHLNVYVADWAINGLNWAYYHAGLLDVTVQPFDLPNPAALKTDTYASWIPAFQQYGKSAMSAEIKPLVAPLTAFQPVYLFTTEVMGELESQLPSDVYTKVKGFDGDGFVNRSDLEEQLANTGIDAQYFPTIENAAEARGMVTTQDMELQLDVQNGDDPAPNLIFDLRRVDIQTDLALGIAESGQAQTLQFSFLNASNSATFRSTTIPGFDETSFGQLIWPVVGESAYAEAMQGLGEQGVPLPIMQGFQFLFQEATLSVQDGYVSIQAQVELKAEKLPAAVARQVYALPRVQAGKYVAPRPLTKAVA